jgi:hypothetical protein
VWRTIAEHGRVNRKLLANFVRGMFMLRVVIGFFALIVLSTCSAPQSSDRATAADQAASRAVLTMRTANVADVRLTVAPESTLDYVRARDFGRWRDAGGDPPCLDVRGQVLAAESDVRITTSVPKSGKCRVLTGRWHDPYTGRTITIGNDMDVDHVVPLKEAWDSGAHAWTQQRREDYANDQVDPDHLIAVDKRANRSKGDRDPANWLPPNAAYVCTYVKQWVAVKRRWGLSVDPAEDATIKSRLAQC